jgi:hypothetical protein
MSKVLADFKVLQVGRLSAGDLQFPATVPLEPPPRIDFGVPSALAFVGEPRDNEARKYEMSTIKKFGTRDGDDDDYRFNWHIEDDFASGYLSPNVIRALWEVVSDSSKLDVGEYRYLGFYGDEGPFWVSDVVLFYHKTVERALKVGVDFAAPSNMFTLGPKAPRGEWSFRAKEIRREPGLRAILGFVANPVDSASGAYSILVDGNKINRTIELGSAPSRALLVCFDSDRFSDRDGEHSVALERVSGTGDVRFGDAVIWYPHHIEASGLAADFRAIEDSPRQLRTETVSMQFDLPDDTALRGNAVLGYKLNPSGGDVSLVIRMNDEEIVNGLYNTTDQRISWRAFSSELLKPTEENEVVFEVEGSGEITLSDIMLWYKREV